MASAAGTAYINIYIQLASSLLLLFFMIDVTVARTTSRMNVIDRCWRRDRNWARNRPRLAMCSVGFSGKMTNNVGRGVRHYTVTDPSDDPVNPRPGTLRYGATLIEGKVWIKFQRNMQINLLRPLLISSFTAIDGRGADVHVANGACLVLHEVRFTTGKWISLKIALYSSIDADVMNDYTYMIRLPML